MSSMVWTLIHNGKLANQIVRLEATVVKSKLSTGVVLDDFSIKCCPSVDKHDNTVH